MVILGALKGFGTTCAGVVRWKIEYGKWKPLNNPKKCVSCHEPTVVRPYSFYCVECAEKKQVCAKCRQPLTDCNRGVEPPKASDLDGEMSD